MRNIRVVRIAETDSTNRWLREHGGEEDMVVVADYQTAGRGCGSNSWESERGRNLLFSVLLHPAGLDARRQFVVSRMVSVALCNVLAEYADGFSIKWPNDIYWRDMKICGILIENRLQGRMVKDCIIGIGLNVNQRRFVSDAPNPVSLCQVVGHDVDRNELLERLVERIADADERLGEEYENLMYKRGVAATYRDGVGEFEATIDGVAPDGCLMLTDSTDCSRRYAHKEVAFVLPRN